MVCAPCVLTVKGTAQVWTYPKGLLRTSSMSWYRDVNQFRNDLYKIVCEECAHF